MPRNNNVVRLFSAERTRREAQHWEDTPQRKITRERNWCRYLLAGFEALSRVFMRPFMSKHTFELWLRAIDTARYAIDHGYYEKLDRLNRKR
jgi:cell division inhibitor SulA